MSDLGPVPLPRMRALAEIGQAAARRDTVAARRRRALDAVADLTGCDAISLHAWDPVRRAHRVVTTWGYEGVRLERREPHDLLDDDGYQLARRNRWPLRLTDVRRRQPPLERVLELREFGEGMTACLFTGDGRYTGVVNLNTYRDEPFDDQLLAVVSLAGPALAELADATASLQSAATVLPAEMPAVVLRRDGTVVALPGRATSLLLAPDGAVLAAARAHAPAAAGTALFLVDAGGAGLVRVVVVRPSDEEESGGALLVAAAPCEVPLSRRELEVATLLVEGATNPEIAARLVVSRHTVATHLAHILERLGVATRGAAAARAIRDGLVLVG